MFYRKKIKEIADQVNEYLDQEAIRHENIIDLLSQILNKIDDIETWQEKTIIKRPETKV